LALELYPDRGGVGGGFRGGVCLGPGKSMLSGVTSGVTSVGTWLRGGAEECREACTEGCMNSVVGDSLRYPASCCNSLKMDFESAASASSAIPA
jgi:hypothetical protein